MCGIDGMSQMSSKVTGFERESKLEFLNEMNFVVIRAVLVALNAPHALSRPARSGRPPFAVGTMPRIHFLLEQFNQSDLAIQIFKMADSVCNRAVFLCPRLRSFVNSS